MLKFNEIITNKMKKNKAIFKKLSLKISVKDKVCYSFLSLRINNSHVKKSKKIFVYSNDLSINKVTFYKQKNHFHKFQEHNKKKMANKFVIIPIILCKVVHLAATLALAIMISMTYFSNGLFMSIFGNQDYTDELVLSFRLLLLLALVISGLTFLSNISGVITMSTKKHKLLNFNRVTLILFTLIHAIAGVAIMFYILPATRKDFGLFLDRMVLSINSNHQYSSSCELMKGISTAYECCGGRFFNGSLDIISQLDADACCTKATDITDPSNIGCIEETFQTIEKDAIFIVIPFGVMILISFHLVL